jgi:hypothetical protein
MPNSKDWRYFADKDGNQLPAVGKGTEIPKDAIEIPHAPTTGLDKADLENKVWIPYEPPYFEKRKEAYDKELGDPGQQLDTLLKALLVVVPALVEGRKLTEEEAKYLTPDPLAAEGTPAGWAGRWLAIKERFPKEN